jgi:hypothetical protein
MRAPSALPPVIPLSAPLVCGGLIYYAGSTWAQMAGDALHATQYGAVPACVFAVILYPFMIVLHDQTVQKIADRDKAAFLAARKPEAVQTVYSTEVEVPNFIDMGKGYHANARFNHATPEQVLKLARMIADGSHSLAYNRFRALDFNDTQIDHFRPELKDYGFAVESKGRYFLTDAGIAHFREIARQTADPHPIRGWRK